MSKQPKAQPAEADFADAVADQLWQVHAMLGALRRQLEAIRDGDAEDVGGEALEAERLLREVRQRVFDLGSALMDDVQLTPTRPEARQLLEAFK